jgi:imidazolonepropionase-like amidohydrolase
MRGMRLLMVGFLLATVAASAGTEAPPGTTPPGAYLFRNVRIWEGRSDALYAGEVLVVGNKIQSVSREGIAPAPELHPVVIDGGGRVLTPGFIDAHVHMSSVLTRPEAAEADPVYVAALEIRGA